jgi:branched-chain amino acid transport system ATP-binding protein
VFSEDNSQNGDSQNVLSVEDVSCGYGDLQVLKNCSIELSPGEAVFVIGPNGAGKSTLLKLIAGEIKSWSGSVQFLGKDVTRLSVFRRSKMGLLHLPEGRGIFSDLSVGDNLQVAALGAGPSGNDRRETVLSGFPELAGREDLPAGLLSGGEQQLLVIAGAIVAGPKLLIIDEPSMGLAPLAVRRVGEVLSRLAQDGLTTLLIEQNAELALDICHRGYVLEGGEIRFSGRSEEFRSKQSLMALYFGN